jgi:collagenase-like PrtC family protease
MGQIVSIAREHGVKSYLTVNTVIYDEEIETLHATIDRACEVGVDAIIATDMAAASAWPYISPRKATSPTSKPSGSSPNGRT